MKAVVLEAIGDVSHFKLKDVPVPAPKKNEVRIHIVASAFNPVDYKIRKGRFGDNTPVILGADCSGVIDAVGENVEDFAVGDEIYAMPFGQCSNGSYAEYLCIPAVFVAKKPKNISLEMASAIPLVAMTAYRAIVAFGAVKKSDSLFIAGAGGGVGSFAVQLAQYLGVTKIFTVAGSEESKRYLHEKMGLKNAHILLYPHLSAEEIVQKVTLMNEGHLFDVALDCVGQMMKGVCLNLARHSGHFITVVPEEKPVNLPVWEAGESLAFAKNLSLHFVFVGSESFSADVHLWRLYKQHLEHITELFESEVLTLPSIEVTGSLSVETVVKSHHLLEAGKTKGKLIMKVNAEKS